MVLLWELFVQQKDSGKNIKVIATETRPIQQGSRLTAFELKHDGIDVSFNS